MSRSLLGRADARPRIHIWQHPTIGTARWSIGPMGCRCRENHPTVGAAVDDALRVAGVPKSGAVIILEAIQ